MNSRSLSILALAVGLIVGGCVTSPTGPSSVDADRVARLAGIAAEVGASAYLIGHVSDRHYFEAASAALAALDASGDYNPARFAAALRTLPIRELKGPDGSLYVDLAIVAWEELSAEAARLDNTEWVKPVLQRVRAGLDRALSASDGGYGGNPTP